ncbi:MAG: hypothetical protein ACRDHK_14440 [Actinomycetota bacterium]
MTEHEEAQGVLYLTAQAVKAFLAAYDPLERRLETLTRSGYTVRVVVTAERDAAPEPRICYLIQMTGDPSSEDGEWSKEDEAFLRNLRVQVVPPDPSPGAGAVAG